MSHWIEKLQETSSETIVSLARVTPVRQFSADARELPAAVGKRRRSPFAWGATAVAFYRKRFRPCRNAAASHGRVGRLAASRKGWALKRGFRARTGVDETAGRDRVEAEGWRG